MCVGPYDCPCVVILGRSCVSVWIHMSVQDVCEPMESAGMCLWIHMAVGVCMALCVCVCPHKSEHTSVHV